MSKSVPFKQIVAPCSTSSYALARFAGLANTWDQTSPVVCKRSGVAFSCAPSSVQQLNRPKSGISRFWHPQTSGNPSVARAQNDANCQKKCKSVCLRRQIESIGVTFGRGKKYHFWPFLTPPTPCVFDPPKATVSGTAVLCRWQADLDCGIDVCTDSMSIGKFWHLEDFFP